MPAPNGNCADRVLSQLNANPDKPVLWSPHQSPTTFEGVCAKAARCQLVLRQAGLVAGDSVLLLARPDPDLFSVLVGLMGAGVTVVFLEPWMPLGHVHRALHLTNPKALIADGFGNMWRYRSRALRQLPVLNISAMHSARASAHHYTVSPVDPEHVATITFTSGTTGTPKGIARSHGFLWQLHEILYKHGADGDFSGPDLTIFPNLALYHLGTGRGSVLVPPNWNINFLKEYRSQTSHPQPQSLTCGPAFLRNMLDAGLIFDSLKSIHVGGALTECNLMERIIHAYPNATVRQIYGGTEVEPVCVVDAQVSLDMSRSRGYFHTLFLGSPIEEIQSRVDSNSVLWVSGPNVCGEYVSATDADLRNKIRDEHGRLWHCMGDRVSFLDDGFWYQGRATQQAGDFLLEQKLMSQLGHSHAFIHRDHQGDPILIGKDSRANLRQAGQAVFASECPTFSTPIRRDKRHRARIDRDATWRAGLRMKRLSVYIAERSPLAVLSVLALGPLVSGWMTLRELTACSGLCLGPRTAVFLGLGFVCSLLFLISARAMDELKDQEKDLTANPTRPLPRGLITSEELAVFLTGAILLMLLCGVVFALAGRGFSALYLFASVSYLWLMYKEFYVGHWLQRFPLLYALSHQLIILPFYCFVFFLTAPDVQSDRSISDGSLAFLFYVSTNLFASMTYEFARKLNPDKHPDAQTYRQIYGNRKASAWTAGFALAAICPYIIFKTWFDDRSFYWENFKYILPFYVLLILLTGWHASRDRLHRPIEAVAALLLIAVAWYGLFAGSGVFF